MLQIVVKKRVIARRLIIASLALVVGVSSSLGIYNQLLKSAQAATPQYQLAARFGHENYFKSAGGIAGTPDGGFALIESACFQYGANSLSKFDSSGRQVFKKQTSGTDNGQLYYPTAVASDAMGNLYVGDQAGRIQKFDSSGNFLAKFGSLGTGSGQFQSCVNSIAVDGQGNIFAVDSDRYGGANTLRIQKFDANGNFITRIGSYGSGAGQFRIQDTTSVAVIGSSLYVTGGGYGGAVQKFDLDGNYGGVAIPQGSGASAIGSAMSIAVGANGIVAVGSIYASGSYGVKYFDINGAYQASTPLGGSSVSSDRFIGIASAASGFYALTGNAVRHVNELGVNQVFLQANGDSSLYGASDIVIDSTDSVYISDRNNNRIQKFNRAGVLIATIPIQGQLYPESLVVDTAGNIYVGLYGAIQKYSASGTLLWELQGNYGSVLATDGTARLYVAKNPSSSINIYDLNGNLLSTFGGYGTGNGQFASSVAMAYAVHQLYVSDSNGVQLFTPDGAFIKKVATYGSVLQSVDASGNFYLASSFGSTINKYSSEGVLLNSYTPGGYISSMAVDSRLSYFVLDGDTSVVRYDQVMIYAPMAAPTNVTSSGADLTSMTIGWTPPAEGQYSSPATKYKVRLRAQGSTADAYSNANITNTAVVATGLAPSTTYQVFVSAGNSDGYGPEVMITARTAEGAPKTISGVAFSESAGKKLLTVSGENLVGADGNTTEFIAALSRSLVRLNGQDLPFCSDGLGVTAQQAIDAYSSYYTNIAQVISDNPPCYELMVDGNVAVTLTQAIIVLPAQFDTTAQGTVSVNGSPTFTFNQRLDTTPTVQVDEAQSLQQHPIIKPLPTFSGVATPGAAVKVTVHSDPVICTTTADSNGNWSCTLSAALPSGEHTVYVQVTNPDNSVENLGPYAVTVGDTITNATPTAPNTGVRAISWFGIGTLVLAVSVIAIALFGIVRLESLEKNTQ